MNPARDEAAGANGQSAAGPRVDRVPLDELTGWWLIGSLIANPDLAGQAVDLDPDDLPQFDQRLWLRAIQRIHADGRRPDCLAVAEQLAADGTLDDLHGAGEPIRLADTYGQYLPHIAEWIGSIRKAAARRRLDSETTRIRQMLADPTVPNEEIAARLEGASKILEAGKPSTFAAMTSAALDAAEFHTAYLVEHVLASGQPCVLAAAKKSLKTTIAIDLTLSLAGGSKFLNHFWTPAPVRVGLMSGESGDATIQETARRIAWSKPWKNLADYDNAVWSFELPRLGQPQTKPDLMGFIQANGLRVLIIDPAYLCLELGDDAGNLFSVGKKLRELTDIGHATGCTIVIVHHCSKGGTRQAQLSPPELESIAWSGFQEWARQWILIGRREVYNPEQGGSHRLWLSCGGSAGHSGLWGVDIEEGTRASEGGRRWNVSIDGASQIIAETISQRETSKEQQAQVKADLQIASDAEKLLAEYRKKPDGDTEKYFRDKARFSGTRGGAANDKLLADGLIEPCEVTKNGRSYDGFRFVPTPAGLTGTDRDSTGTDSLGPTGSTERDSSPYRGCPGPAPWDMPETVSAPCEESSPADLVVGGRPA